MSRQHVRIASQIKKLFKQRYTQIDRGRDARLHKEMQRRGWVNELLIVSMGMHDAQRLIEEEKQRRYGVAGDGEA